MKRMTYTTNLCGFSPSLPYWRVVDCLPRRGRRRDTARRAYCRQVPTEQFDAIWHGINQNYVFWEADPTDWDAVYSQYPSALRGAGQAGSGSYRRLAETV